MRSDAENLKRICQAIDNHDATCEFGERAVAIEMNPFEVERLGWSDVRGLPIHTDEKLPTGRFRVVCPGQPDVPLEVGSRDRELVPA